MKLIFIDETGDAKFTDYFGICCAIIDSFYYSQLKKQFHNILLKNGWDSNIEFKGSCLFSAKKGDVTISIDRRIDIANDLLDLNAAKKNARMHFHYFRKKSNNHKKDYLTYLPIIIEKALSKAPSGAGKDIVAIQCDNRSDIKIKELRKILYPVVKKKKYVLFEDIVMPASRFETVGILYADLIGYLVARVETISSDMDLFENIPKEELENNGKVKKLQSSKKLLEQIKYLQKYRIKTSKE
jgi:hypothetical protein